MAFLDPASGGLLPPGPAGASAYDTWRGLGNTGTQADFIAALTGRGISFITTDVNYHIIITMSDGTVIDGGLLPGAAGDGTGGVSKADLAGVITDTLAALAAKADLSAVAALLGAALTIVDAQKLDATMVAFSLLTDALPALPSNPASYPDAGGWFREGDANGYRLVRILPKS